MMKTLSEMQSGLHRHQHRELFERTLDDDEIESLIDKARESALAIKNYKKRDKEEREQAKEVLDFIVMQDRSVVQTHPLLPPC